MLIGVVSRNSSIPVTACTNNGEDSEFMCGLNAANCKNNSTLFTLPSANITLRPSELEALVKPAVSSALAQTTTQAAVQMRITVTAMPTANPDAIYTPGQMAGLGVGLAVPLLVASFIAFSLWRRDRARTPKLMYPLPDDMEDPYTAKDGRPLTSGANSLRPPVSRDGSILSFNTISAGTPAHMQTFAERYQVMKGASGFQIQRVELDASPAGNYGDHELHDLKVPIPTEF
jgi:hypothetical protein